MTFLESCLRLKTKNKEQSAASFRTALKASTRLKMRGRRRQLKYRPKSRKELWRALNAD